MVMAGFGMQCAYYSRCEIAPCQANHVALLLYKGSRTDIKNDYLLLLQPKYRHGKLYLIPVGKNNFQKLG
jgi:hypothetical protein